MKYFFESKHNLEIYEKDNLDFPPHIHDYFEIGYIHNGTAELTVEEKNYNLKSGNFFVIFPNQIHYYKNSNSVFSKIIIFSPNLISEYNDIISSNIPDNPIINTNEFGKDILTLIFKIKTKDVNVLKGLLLSLFGLLKNDITFKNIEKYNISTLKGILLFCEEHYTEPITVSDVADSLHISRYHIAHIFRQKLNTTYNEYITAKRIEYASLLLRSEELSIIDVAYKSGFNSIRSFNRNFLKYHGISPNDYKKLKSDKA